MKENTLELSFEMYEELKETLIKTLRTELAEARSQLAATIDTDAIKHLQIRILQLEQTQTKVSEVQQERGHRIEQRLQAISERQEQICERPRSADFGDGRECGRDGDSRGAAAADGAAPLLGLSGRNPQLLALHVDVYRDRRCSQSGSTWSGNPTASRYDNDLKYRYVLMKGEASPKRLSELEELFEVERNQRRIDSMRRDVEKYERLVRRKAALDEQARLKAQEAEQLKRDAAKLKKQVALPFLPQR